MEKINLSNLKLSYHCLHENKIRRKIINTVVGNNWGQIIKQEWFKGAYRCLTDTGLIFIISPECNMIMTYYLALAKVVQGMYDGNAPKYILKRIKKNSSRYKMLYDEYMINSREHEGRLKEAIYE